jgi:capsid protein
MSGVSTVVGELGEKQLYVSFKNEKDGSVFTLIGTLKELEEIFMDVRAGLSAMDQM